MASAGPEGPQGGPRAASQQDYEWAASQARQAAEKAVKALLHCHGAGDTASSSRSKLREASTVARSISYSASRRTRQALHARPLPERLQVGASGLYYDEESAGRAIGCAEEILNWVRGKLEKLGLKM